MIALLLLGCLASKQAQPLYAAPIRKTEIKPVQVLEAGAGECTRDRTIGPGDSVNCVGVLLPLQGAISAATYAHHKRRDEALTVALRAAYDAHAQDRAYAEDRHQSLYEAWVNAEKRSKVQSTLGAPVFLGGVAFGLAAAVGVYWASDQL